MNAPKPKFELKYDGPITIAVGRSRLEKSWKNREFIYSEFLDKLSVTHRTHETFDEYKKMKRPQQDQIKDVGGFVGGCLKGGRRTTEAIQNRHILTLDADFGTPDFWDIVRDKIKSASIVYSTHKHSPDTPRLRLVIPLSRPVFPDEYQAIGRMVAKIIGIDYFDDTTYQPHRLMYWPSTSADGEYFFRYQDEPWMDADEILGMYDDWADASYWPESSRAHSDRKREAKEQGDPLSKPGLVGAFCRTYTIPEAIEKYLFEEYTPTDKEGRYTYTAGSCAAGLVLYEDKFAYSHHGTDPISEKLCNAFDLVRIHKFGKQDEDITQATAANKVPSYKSMCELIMADEAVRVTIGKERLALAQEEFGVLEEETAKDPGEWLKKLKTDKKGNYVSTINNVKLILENDPRIAGRIAANDFSKRQYVLKSVPWLKVTEPTVWSDSDDCGLRHYLENVYDITGREKIDDALQVIMQKNKFHPVREYLNGLWWDGKSRVDTLLVDYLGADDTAYNRAVTRKTLVAAVARIMIPGIKFDNMLVLVGPQGIGKSYFIGCLGKQWYSDGLKEISGKETYENLQGFWIVEMGELVATKRTDVEAIKHFLSQQVDRFRLPYGKRTGEYPRQCVIIGTTNENDFLRDPTGNRRFWPVDVCKIKPAKSVWNLPDEVDQVWAEAVMMWDSKEPLFLDADMDTEARQRQEYHTESNTKEGMIRDFLDRLLPENWDDVSLQARRDFIHGRSFGSDLEGTRQRERVCVAEIWCELFEKRLEDLGGIQSREINNILRKMSGWVSYEKDMARFKIYGRQRCYVKDQVWL